MPAVKLGRDNTSKNLSRLLYGYKRDRKLTNEKLQDFFGVSCDQSVRKILDDPQGEYFRRVFRGCKKLGISREELFAAIDY